MTREVGEQIDQDVDGGESCEKERTKWHYTDEVRKVVFNAHE